MTKTLNSKANSKREFIWHWSEMSMRGDQSYLGHIWSLHQRITRRVVARVLDYRVDIYIGTVSTRGIGFNVLVLIVRGCVLIHPAQKRGGILTRVLLLVQKDQSDHNSIPIHPWGTLQWKIYPYLNNHIYDL